MSSNLKDKLTNFESAPPPQAWDRIVSALDESVSPLVSEKLFEFQQTPPARTWDKIITALEEGSTQAKVIPFYRRYAKPMRYSGAAALMILVGLALFFLMNNNDTSGDLASQNDLTAIPPLKKDTSDNLSGKEVKVVFTPEDQEVPVAKKNGNAVNKSKRSQERASRTYASNQPDIVRRRQQIDFSLPVDRYMVYSDGQNEPVKLSKKLYELFACVPEDGSCRQRIQALQQKLATKAVSSDFTGVLDMLQQLKENQ